MTAMIPSSIVLVGLFLVLAVRLTAASSRLHHASRKCVADSGSLFDEEVLGPSYSFESLFYNVQYPNGENVEIPRLASGLLYPTYVDTEDGEVTFVQEEQYFGRDGQYTEEFLNQHGLMVDFWKTDEGGRPPILLIGLHSEVLANETQLQEALLVDYLDTNGYDPSVVTDENFNVTVQAVRMAIETELPQNYSNSALSQEAFFQAEFFIAGFEKSSVIVLGDGELDYGEWLDLGEQENIALLAHEFSHAIQFIMDLEDNDGDIDAYYAFFDSTPEGTRRWELEADALAAYFLAHEQGLNYSVELLVQASREGWHTGDCDPTYAGHHGTPDQRECATLWGGDEGLDSMTGEPVTMREFRELFSQSFDSILALDPAACHLSEPGDTSTTSSATGRPVVLGSLAGTVVMVFSSLWSLFY